MGSRARADGRHVNLAGEREKGAMEKGLEKARARSPRPIEARTRSTYVAVYNELHVYASWNSFG